MADDITEGDQKLARDVLARVGLGDLCFTLNAGGFILARSLPFLTHSDMDELGIPPWSRQALVSVIERYSREQAEQTGIVLPTIPPPSPRSGPPPPINAGVPAPQAAAPPASAAQTAAKVAGPAGTTLPAAFPPPTAAPSLKTSTSGNSPPGGIPAPSFLQQPPSPSVPRPQQTPMIGSAAQRSAAPATAAQAATLSAPPVQAPSQPMVIPKAPPPSALQTAQQFVPSPPAIQPPASAAANAPRAITTPLTSAAEMAMLAVAEFDRQRYAEARSLLFRATALSANCGHALLFLAAMAEALPHLFTEGDPAPDVLRKQALASAARAAGAAFVETAATLTSPTAKWLAATWLDAAEGRIDDQARIVRLLRDAAERGHVLARGALGLRVAFGSGVAQDLPEAARMFRLAAEQGSAEARNCLGMMAFHGIGEARDAAEAVALFNQAAEQRHADAVCNLADCWRTGAGLSCDAAIAAQMYRLAAKQRHARATASLGFCYYAGEGVPQDRSEAAALWRLAVEFGSTAAVRYLEKVAQSPGEPVQPPQPVAPFAGIKTRGKAEQACLAAFAAMDAGDVARTRTALVLAAEADPRFGPALLFLRALRLSFPRAFAATDREADDLLRAAKARESQNTGSAFCLSLVTPQQSSATALWLAGYWAELIDRADASRSAQLYKAACSAGPHALALNNLASLYITGRGVERNLAEAQRQLQLSAEQGNALALANLAGLRTLATKAQPPPQ